MSTNPIYTNITNEELLLVNILNTIYNDNILQIQTLQESNNQIRNLITNILYTRGQQRRNRLYSRNNNTNSISNTNTNNLAQDTGRVIINNTPYVISDYQEYYIPASNNTTNTSTTSNSTTNNTPFNLSRFIVEI